MWRRTVVVFVVSILATHGAAVAQSPPMTVNPVATTTAPAPASAGAAERPSRGADARVCLEFPTNEQIIACAEKYRPRKRSV